MDDPEKWGEKWGEKWSEKWGEMWGDKWGERWGDKSTATRIRIARIIAEQPGVSVREIAAALGINTSAVERHITAMRNVGALELVGSPKGGYWKLME